MGHGGGHFWISPETSQAMDRGHFDATAALAGQSFTIHQPEDCTPGCPWRYWRPFRPVPDDGVLDTEPQ
jgi:hypothetical protein